MSRRLNCLCVSLYSVSSPRLSDSLWSCQNKVRWLYSGWHFHHQCLLGLAAGLEHATSLKAGCLPVCGSEVLLGMHACLIDSTSDLVYVVCVWGVQCTRWKLTQLFHSNHSFSTLSTISLPGSPPISSGNFSLLLFSSLTLSQIYSVCLSFHSAPNVLCASLFVAFFGVFARFCVHFGQL